MQSSVAERRNDSSIGRITMYIARILPTRRSIGMDLRKGILLYSSTVFIDRCYMDLMVLDLIPSMYICLI